MEEAIGTIEYVIDYYQEKLDRTTLPEDEMIEIDLWKRIYHLRATVRILKELSDDGLG